MINHLKVLVVDDSPTTCLFVASTLEQAGFEVEVALRGREGLTKIMTFRPSCLILDVMLPDINGYAICRQVQQSVLHNAIHIILISAKNAPLDRSYGLRQGANRYLPKPFTANELVEAVWEGVPESQRHIVPSTLASTPQTSAPPALSKLLPRRIRDEGTMRTHSPFAHMAAIGDRQAYRLYSAIDGRKTLAELATVTGLEEKAVTRAIRVLLAEHCIQVYDTAGHLVTSSL